MKRLSTFAALAVAVAAGVTACGGDDTPTGGAATGKPAATSNAKYTTPLKGICPDTVVVQTNWWPEADHGGTYQLIGPGGKVDANKNSYTGPLGTTGINLEIRAGGPATGFQQVSSLLYQDDSILLGYVGTDEAIQNSVKAPTVAVFATYDKNPQIFMWGNPKWDFKSVADIGKSGAKVLAFDGATYLSLFTQKGLLNKKQLDTSYNGSPARFVAADGDVVQQGFATNEPYAYENQTRGWNKPVKFLLVNEYPVYQSALSIRADKLAANQACLSKLIPLFQQAQIDYLNDPAPVNKTLVDIVGKLKTSGFSIDEGGTAAAVEQIKKLKLVENGSDGTLGSFDTARVQTLIDTLSPVFEAQKAKLKAGLTPADLTTNEFLDPKIAL
ncbi:hypothetical protein [Solirubrobacter soli]|uniref:hypothetical protein n=1 Tax=Solirubrobacter soli TaxID=363832 RepID=UPI000408FD49|nr:hypothetical protein [Solirubrobacter soli]